MSDLISRQAAIEATCYNCTQKEICDGICDDTDRLRELPTIDAVPVVRCKDCKHRPIDTGGHNYGQDLFFPDEDECPCQCGDQWYSWMPSDDWFCPNGERKTDD